MKSFQKLTTAAVALTSVLAASCTSYSIHPEAKAIAFPARLPTPIPIQVAIATSSQSFSRDVGDQAVELSRRLDQSGLFEAVHHPIRPTARLGATMELSVNRTVQMTDLGVLGNMAAVLFMFNRRGEYFVDGTMVFLKGTEVIRAYSARGKAVLTYKTGVTPKGELEVTQAAARAMQARFIEQLVQDREFLTQKLKASP